MTPDEFKEHEELNKALNDQNLRDEYASAYDDYRPGLVARMLGAGFVGLGNLVYGRDPGYAKFRALEVIARIPYQSWEVASYTMLTYFYTDEQRAIELIKTGNFSRMAQDNETMHVVVISQIVKRLNCAGFFRHTLIPLVFAFVYFWLIYFIYLFSRKASLELNYVFENHAYEQYQQFLEDHQARLKITPLHSSFLDFYGRHIMREYDFFESVRNDELIHRNRSIRELEAHIK